MIGLSSIHANVEIIYDLLSNIKIQFNTKEVPLPNFEIAIDQNLRLKVVKASLQTDDQLKLVLDVKIENETLDKVSEKITLIKEKVSNTFKEFGDNLATILYLEYNFPPIRLIDIRIQTRVEKEVIDNGKRHIFLEITEQLQIKDKGSSLSHDKQLSFDILNNAVINTLNLTTLDQNSKKLFDLLKTINEWYLSSFNYSNDVDKYISYLMVFEIWKTYKAYIDYDNECLPSEKKKPPHKKCLNKAIGELCQGVFSNFNITFEEFYNEGRNKVIHEVDQEAALKYFPVASECIKKVIEAVQNEIPNYLKK